MPDLGVFAGRSRVREEMDDFSIQDSRLRRALEELRYVNRFLGGYAALRRTVEPLLRSWSGEKLDVLDLGSGLSDFAVEFLKWSDAHGISVRYTALEANPATVRYARQHLDENLLPGRRTSVRVIEGNALRAPFEDGAFHIATASLFLHHFEDDNAVELLREMSRLASVGLVVNDLYRHKIAYAGISAAAAVLPVSRMFRHDGPISVRRAFTPGDLKRLASAAGLARASVRHHWAFRLTLSTLDGQDPR